VRKEEVRKEDMTCGDIVDCRMKEEGRRKNEEE
jgi:hypothetical protein